MAVLTDYLDLEDLRELQAMFRTAAGVELEICCARTGPIHPAEVDEARASDRTCTRPDEAPIVIGSDVVGCVRLLDAEACGGRAEGFLKLMADVVARLCEQQSQLHTRASELATLYRLTAEFTAQRDLQRVLDMVVSTVVNALKVKACAIRLLSGNGDQLLIRAVANLSATYLNKGPILMLKAVSA